MLVSREDVSDVVVHYEDVLAGDHESASCRCSSIFRFCSGSFASTRCRKSAVSSSRRSGDFTVLHDDRLRVFLDLRLVLLTQLLAGVDEIGRSWLSGSDLTFSRRSNRSCRAVEAEGRAHIQSKCFLVQLGERFLRRGKPRVMSTSSCAISSTMLCRLRLVVLDDQQIFSARWSMKVAIRAKRRYRAPPC